MRGFTLIEVMTALGLFVVVSGAALSLLVGVGGSSQRVSNIGDVQSAARLALDQLALEIQQAGLGAGTGQVLIGQGSPPVGRRVPVIWSGPNVTVTEPGGQTLVTNSLYILGTETATIGRSSSAVELVGTVSADSPTGTGTSGITLYCADSTGTPRDCATAPQPGVSPGGPLAGATFPPLLIGDFRNAALVTPTALTSLTGSPPRQTLTFKEQTTASFAPDPKFPIGFTRGANVSRARVSHWYLRQATAGAPPVLVRSHPTLSTAAISNQCLAGDNPFLDETNTSGGAVGTDVGGGPILSLQFRFLTDPNNSDDPAQYQMVNQIGTCDFVPVAQLREVRIQVVSVAKNPDKALDATTRIARYHTPAFEGVASAPAWNGTGTCPAGACDPYPRRALTERVVPRNIQGSRL
jgi:prepilin-type N-terminal cleavage/methylation domain-containing protein